MKYHLIVLLLMFIFHPVLAQKRVEIPEHRTTENFMKELPEHLATYELEDLQSSRDSLTIRIWQRHEIFTLKIDNSLMSEYVLHTAGTKPVFSATQFSEEDSREIFDFMQSNRIDELQDDKYRGIDGSFVFFEMATKSSYKLISFWSPDEKRSADQKAVVEILAMIHQKINSKALQDEFMNALRPGTYPWGMTNIRVDRFLDESINRTDFYLKMEKRIKNELQITEQTNHWEYPLVMVDGIKSQLADLNLYKEAEIERFDILRPDDRASALYGTNAKYGVIILETK